MLCKVLFARETCFIVAGNSEYVGVSRERQNTLGVSETTATYANILDGIVWLSGETAKRVRERENAMSKVLHTMAVSVFTVSVYMAVLLFQGVVEGAKWTSREATWGTLLCGLVMFVGLAGATVLSETGFRVASQEYRERNLQGYLALEARYPTYSPR
jgi:hypothetical protein